MRMWGACDLFFFSATYIKNTAIMVSQFAYMMKWHPLFYRPDKSCT